MKRIAWLLLFVAASPLAGRCSKGGHAEHSAQRPAPEPAPPTPDTTPIASLRTPAGLVLGVEATAPPQTTPTPIP